MELVKEFIRGKSRARLLMLAALALSFISQFFLYETKSDNSYMSLGPNFSSTVYLDVTARAAATGWEMHPYAYIILLVLAFALLRDDVAEMPWFDCFGYWLSAFLLFAASSPGAPFRAKGAAMGFVAFLIALAAAILQQRTRKSNPQKTN